MYNIDEVENMLNEIAEELPEDFFRFLNGGVMLLPETKHHSQGNLFIMGEYNCRADIGRYIVIYYGSFISAFGHLDRENFIRELKYTLIHEFTHHMEALSGERTLEIKDEIDLERYKNKDNKSDNG